VKISIVIPLCDRRNVGWRALESAVSQDYPRDKYEVVAVTGVGSAAERDAEGLIALTARCNVVVHTDLQIDDVASEIRLYQAGYQRSTGDVLFFVEGHTVLEKRCCAVIDAYFCLHPESAIAWAPRLNHGESPLGSLISIHNRRHELRAIENGVFSLGATNVIRRSLFERLGGLDAHFLRFSETAVFHRLLQEDIEIGRIPAPLATHYNDMSVSQWRKLVMSTGEAKCHYYNALLSRGEDVRAQVRHGIYLRANRAWSARVLYPAFRMAGTLFLGLALGTWRIGHALAYRFYVLGLGFTDLSGFCRARIRAAKQSARVA
jgi:hypothetical protein